jgi:disulfide bond formation protein DsbB
VNMKTCVRKLNDPAFVTALIALAGSATLGVALFYQYAGGYAPCALCLLQRWPYYLGIPLAIAATGLIQPRGYLQIYSAHLLALLGIVFAFSAALGIYHAGIEWAWWAGPASCSPGAEGAARNAADLFYGHAPRFVACNAAPWRMMGLSFAGWNAAVSFGLAALAFTGAAKARA